MSTQGNTGAGSALLIDSTRCIGCGACALACKQANGLPASPGDFLHDELSSTTFSVVTRHDTPAGARFARHLCMHCGDPTCASVCLVGAFAKTAEGPVQYLEERCIGCRYCMQACPFAIPRYEWEKVLPRVRKCSMCAGSLAPACAAACPTGATVYGPRRELLTQARARIAAEPSRYVDRVYGEREVGGTAVLLLSDVPFEDLGYPAELPEHAMPELTWRVMSKIPRFAVAAGVFLAGVWWITKRRDDVHAADGAAGEDHR